MEVAITLNSKKELIEYVRDLFLPGLPFVIGEGMHPEAMQWTNRHKQILAQEKLEEKILRIARQSLHKGFQPKKQQWTNNHQQINYQGTIIDIKYPTLLGYLTITLPRPLGEQWWNHGYLIYESPKRSLQREAKTYEALTQKGFPTLLSLQNLLEGEKKHLPPVLLTSYEPDALNAVKYFKTTSYNKKRALLEEGSQLLHQLHKEGYVWGDPWWGNVLVTQEGIKLLDFGFKVNPSWPKPYQEMEDFSRFVISGVYRTKLPAEEVINTMLKGYSLNHEQKQALQELTERIINQKIPLLLRPIKHLFYDITVFGIDEKAVKSIRKQLTYQAR